MKKIITLVLAILFFSTSAWATIVVKLRPREVCFLRNEKTLEVRSTLASRKPTGEFQLDSLKIMKSGREGKFMIVVISDNDHQDKFFILDKRMEELSKMGIKVIP